MGICYQSPAIKKPDAAIRCFKRALEHGDQEGVSINFLVCQLRFAQNMRESGRFAHPIVSIVCLELSVLTVG